MIALLAEMFAQNTEKMSRADFTRIGEDEQKIYLFLLMLFHRVARESSVLCF